MAACFSGFHFCWRFPLYSLYSFHNQQDYLSAQMQNGGTLDPLLYFSSSVFIVGAGLFGHAPCSTVDKTDFYGRKKVLAAFALCGVSSRSAYKKQSELRYDLSDFDNIRSVSLTQPQHARSTGTAEDRICYMDGADVVVQEAWESAGTSEFSILQGTGNSTDHIEPNFEKISIKFRESKA